MSVWGILGDAATSAVGKALLSAALPYWGGTLIEYLGGTNSLLGRSVEVSLASTPGLVKGEPFTQAFTSAYALRLKMVADYYSLGTADAIVNQAYQKIADDPTFRQALSSALGSAGTDLAEGLHQAGMGPEDVAKKYGTRPDVAAMAINAQAHQNIYPIADFDIQNGRRFYRTIGKVRESTRLASEVADAVRRGDDPLKIQQLRQAYANALVEENRPKAPLTPGELLSRWHRAEELLGSDSKIALAYKKAYLETKAAQDRRTFFLGPDAAMNVRFASPDVPIGGTPKKSVLRDVISFGVLTSPAWIPFLLLRK